MKSFYLCSICNLEKSPEYFGKNKKHKIREGLSYKCKSCTQLYLKEYRTKNKEVIAIKKKVAHVANKSENNAKSRSYYAKNRKQLLAKLKEKHKGINRDKINSKRHEAYSPEKKIDKND